MTDMLIRHVPDDDVAAAAALQKLGSSSALVCTRVLMSAPSRPTSRPASSCSLRSGTGAWITSRE